MLNPDLTHCRYCGKAHPETVEVCTCLLDIELIQAKTNAENWRNDANRYRHALDWIVNHYGYQDHPLTILEKCERALNHVIETP